MAGAMWLERPLGDAWFSMVPWCGSSFTQTWILLDGGMCGYRVRRWSASSTGTPKAMLMSNAETRQRAEGMSEPDW